MQHDLYVISHKMLFFS